MGYMDLECPPKVPRCHHIRVDGTRCGSPALRGQSLCYYHTELQLKLQQQKRAKRNKRNAFSMPILEDATSVQAALMQTINAILDGTIDRRKGALVLYGLQTASGNLKRMRPPFWSDVVTQPPRDI